MTGRVVQLTDTHIVREGSEYLGLDTARYLADALDAVHALDTLPDYIVVTGDLVNSGDVRQYARFREVMSSARVPYFVIPGNHDDAASMRSALPPNTYGNASENDRHYTVDDFPVRFVGLDCNVGSRWPGAVMSRASLAWLDATLRRKADRPTIVAVHQPPFRSGLHYIDAGGFIGSSKLRALIDRHPHVGAVVSGHIHCVRSASWAHAKASSAASTSPQPVPYIFAKGRIAGLARESAGFAVHDLRPDGTFARTDFRRTDDGDYLGERDGSILDTNRLP